MLLPSQAHVKLEIVFSFLCFYLKRKQFKHLTSYAIVSYMNSKAQLCSGAIFQNNCVEYWTFFWMFLFFLYLLLDLPLN